jgi:hypothetical protein
MINLTGAEFLFALLILIIAYFISHTINGALQAHGTSLLGDSTAKHEGHTSLNPFVHVDLFGFLALIFLGIGWLQTVPLDPAAFTGRWRYSKLLAAFWMEAFVSIALAMISLVLSVLLYGYSLTSLLVMQLFTYYSKSFLLFFSSSSHLQIANLFTNHETPLAIAIAFLLISIVYLNILIAAISLIFNFFRYLLLVGFEKGYTYMEYASYLSFFGPFLVVFVFGDRLICFLLGLTQLGASHLAHLCGA